MTTPCTTTPPPTVTDSLRRTCRRRGGDKPACGQLLRHLTTGFGQPYGVRWTPPGCPLAPSHDDGGVLQLRINHINQKERDDLRQLPVAEPALANIDSPDRWAIPEYRSGPYRLVKSIASPLLANIFLHEVLDVWFEQDIKPRLKGRAVLIRYADDAVLGFSQEEDARRVLAVLPKRFGKYGLSLHPEKTRLIDFRPPRGGSPRGPSQPARQRTFDLLGFTHYWAKSRRGYWVIKRKTATDRLTRAITRIGRWCREHRHAPVSEQHRELAQKLRGHYGYYGITGNSQMLAHFLQAVKRRWHYWLNRRSQRGRWNWERFARVLRARPLPPAIPVHSTWRHAANP